MNDACDNPFASPTATDDPPPVDDRPRLRGRPVFWPITLAPVITAAALPLAIAAMVGIGQLLPPTINWPRTLPDAGEALPMLGVFAGVSSAGFALLVAPAVWWGWRKHRLTPLAIHVAATLLAAFCLVGPSFFFVVSEPNAEPMLLILLIGMPLLVGFPLLTPVLLYAWWLHRLVRQAEEPAEEPARANH